MRQTSALVAACVLVCAVSSQAQMPQGPMKPGPEVKRLAYFVGTWKSEGEVKAGPMGPGGMFSSTDKAAWMYGGFFVVIHSDGMMGTQKEAGLGILGYDANKKVYTYHAFDSDGNAVTSTGTVTGDTWNWTSEDKMGSTTMSVKVTIKELSPTAYTFKLEMSQNGGPWVTVQEAKSTKVMAPAKH